MQAVTIPTKTYKSLLQKARAFDRVLALTKQSFPLDEYSPFDMQQFKKADTISLKQRQAILSIIKNKSGGKI